MCQKVDFRHYITQYGFVDFILMKNSPYFCKFGTDFSKIYPDMTAIFLMAAYWIIDILFLFMFWYILSMYLSSSF